MGNQMLGDHAGLAAAFLFAGAAGVIAPLWSIDDAIAREIAIRFYERALAGEAPAEILRTERAAFRDTPETIVLDLSRVPVLRSPGAAAPVGPGRRRAPTSDAAISGSRRARSVGSPSTMRISWVGLRAPRSTAGCGAAPIRRLARGATLMSPLATQAAGERAGLRVDLALRRRHVAQDPGDRATAAPGRHPCDARDHDPHAFEAIAIEAQRAIGRDVGDVARAGRPRPA